ncbi:MAG: phosphatase PAP2 family protein [Acidimicrobiales bacterium]|jgi:membrane-associated phospholipid phosphatase
MVGLLAPISASLSFMFLGVTKVLSPKGLNTSVYLDINNFSRHTPWAHGFMQTYAVWLGLTVLTVLFVVGYVALWWHGASRQAALLALCGAATVVALGINQVIGRAAAELRPYVTHPHALVLIARANDYAFPSDHAVVAGGLATSLLLIARATGRYLRYSGSSLHTEKETSLRADTETSLRTGTLLRTETETPLRTGGTVAVLVVIGACSVVVGLFLCFARIYVGVHYPGDVVAGLLLGAAVVIVFSLLRPFIYWLADLAVSTPLGFVFCRPGARALP